LCRLYERLSCILSLSFFFLAATFSRPIFLSLSFFLDRAVPVLASIGELKDRRLRRYSVPYPSGGLVFLHNPSFLFLSNFSPCLYPFRSVAITRPSPPPDVRSGELGCFKIALQAGHPIPHTVLSVSLFFFLVESPIRPRSLGSGQGRGGSPWSPLSHPIFRSLSRLLVPVEEVIPNSASIMSSESVAYFIVNSPSHVLAPFLFPFPFPPP